MKFAKLFRKIQAQSSGASEANVVQLSKLFKELKSRADHIIDFELEKAKYLAEVRNAHEAHQYICQEMENIKDKADRMRKQVGFALMPKRIY
jgi:protein subunit release factor A